MVITLVLLGCCPYTPKGALGGMVHTLVGPCYLLNFPKNALPLTAIKHSRFHKS